MSGASNLALRIAGAPKDRCTHQVMPSVALEAGLIMAAEAEGMSKRDRRLPLSKSRAVKRRRRCISGHRR